MKQIEGENNRDLLLISPNPQRTARIRRGRLTPFIFGGFLAHLNGRLSHPNAAITPNQAPPPTPLSFGDLLRAPLNGRVSARKESAVKPGSVLDSHSSGMRVAAQL